MGLADESEKEKIIEDGNKQACVICIRICKTDQAQFRAQFIGVKQCLKP
jgi:hypothetical protein